MNILGLLVVGLLAGGLATMISRRTGFGIAGNIVLGLVGSVVGGWGLTSPVAGMPDVILMAFAGATVLLVLVHLVTRNIDC